MTFDLEGARERQRREPHDVLGDEDAAEMHVRPADGNPGDVLLRAAEGAAVPVVGGRGEAVSRGRCRARSAGGSRSTRSCPVVIVRTPKQ